MLRLVAPGVGGSPGAEERPHAPAAARGGRLRPARGGAGWAGVQCKLRNREAGGGLSREKLEAEVEKARGFNPSLAIYVLATTAPRDAKAQEAAREITEAQKKKGSFPVSVAAWDDIEELLDGYPEVVAKHFPELGLGGLESARANYLRSVWSRLAPLPLTGIGLRGSHREQMPLAAVYTAIDVTAEIRVERQPKGKGGEAVFERDWGLGLRGEPGYLEQLVKRVRREADEEAASRRQAAEGDASYSRRWTALEAAPAVPRLVLLGSAGSGKSTFARYLALCLAGELLKADDANLKRLNGLAADGAMPHPEVLPWPHGALLPVFVELRKLVRSEAFLKADGKGGADDLLAFLEETAPRPADVGFGELLRRSLLDEDGALVVLDGLDETPADERSRRRLKRVIASFARRYPKCRVLLTCRPYAYGKESSWRLADEGFEEAALAPFDEAKRRAFITGWYRQLATRGQIDPERADRRAARLLEEIRSTGYLEPLAELPLMLTMMADLHASSGGRLPDGRAGLYERSVELLLDRWNEARELLDGESVSEHLGMTVAQMRDYLGTFKHQWTERTVDERRVDYLHQRSGILLGESRELYRFPHRSYQEYLAACHLTRTDFPPLLLREVEADPDLWREVLLLAAGRVAGTPFTVWALLEGLVPAPPGPQVEAGDRRFLPALCAALAVRESGLQAKVQRQDEPKLERIRRWLERSLELGALPPVDRAEAGRLLGVLGDRRPGVGLAADGTPEVD